MSALPKFIQPVEEFQSPEVIYLVVPPTPAIEAPAPKPYSLVERMSLVFFNVLHTSKARSDKSHALAFAVSATIITGLWAYNVKSAFGIDLFPHQHIENFAPVPGWQR